MIEVAAKRKQLVNRSTFTCSGEIMLDDMGSKEVLQAPHASLLLHLFARVEARIAECIITYLLGRGLAVSLLKLGWQLSLF